VQRYYSFTTTAADNNFPVLGRQNEES
jgi:hypothetical protein